MSLCHTEGLNAWDIIQESEKRTEQYTVIESSNEIFTNFLQRSTKAVNRTTTDSEVRQRLIHHLAFKMLVCNSKRYLGPKRPVEYLWKN